MDSPVRAGRGPQWELPVRRNRGASRPAPAAAAAESMVAIEPAYRQSSGTFAYQVVSNPSPLAGPDCLCSDRLGQEIRAGNCQNVQDWEAEAFSASG